MDRARRGTSAAIFLVLGLGLLLLEHGPSPARTWSARAAAAVTWPVSSVMVSEVQTGGASASDEFVELTNAGGASVDLAGLEVVYVSSSGATITRKAAWSEPLLLEPGRHLLLANSLGIHAALADSTYSGGLAATGGSIVLRHVGGSPIDAIGWGDATSAYVEGPAAPAPPAGSSLERRPGGIGGNTVDSNDNLADWLIQGAPNPQNLAAPPVPAPPASFEPSGSLSLEPTPAPSITASPPPASPLPTESTGPSSSPDPGSPAPSGSPFPSPSADPEPSVGPSVPPASMTPAPTAEPSPSIEPTPGPSGAPSGQPTVAPTAPPSPTPSPSPTSEPTMTAVPTTPTSPTPSLAPSPGPSPSPSPTPAAVIEVRAWADGTPAVIEGTLTTPLGLLEEGRSAFVEDATGGIAVYLDVAPPVQWAAGTVVRVGGTLDQRYGARTLRAALGEIATLGAAPLPGPMSAATGSIGEATEGRRVSISGATVGAPTAFADGTGLLVDDGSGAVRVIVSPDALGATAVPAGTRVSVIGPVGQRDSSGTGLAGYRVHATVPGDLAVLPGGPDPSRPPSSAAPSPSGSPSALPSLVPTPSAFPTPTATPDPTPASSPTPSPTPGPTSSPAVLAVGDARRQPLGATVVVAGVITAEAGRLGTPAILPIEDATGGLVLHLPDGMAAPARGTRVEARGSLAAPYGQLELKVAADGLRSLGLGTLPVAPPVTALAVGEALEARLIAVDGAVAAAPWRSTSRDIAFDIVDAEGGTLRVMADASSGLATSAVRAGQAYRLTGIAGQRATRRGALDGYRLWLRDARDVTPLASPVAGTAIGGPTPAATVAIAAALGMPDATVTVEGIVTVPAVLLDATARRVVVQDETAAIEVLLPVGAVAPGAGSRVMIHGQVGRAYGAPRLRAGTAADAVAVLAGRGSIEPVRLAAQPGMDIEWRLARAVGRVASVTRLGARWRADLDVEGQRILVDGLPGSGIPSTSLVAGRMTAITGIVRRPYPGATDQRFGLVPRWRADLTAEPGGDGRVTVAPGNDVSGAGVDGDSEGTLAGAGLGDRAADVDLATLGEHAGERVRVGGLVVDAHADGFALDDGTAVGTVRLEGQAAVYLGLLEPGDAVNAVGLVVPDAAPDAWLVVVSSPEGLLRVGDLGEPKVVQPAAVPSTEASPATAGQDPRTDGRDGRLGLGSLFPDVPGDAAGLVSLGVLTALSLAASLARRRRLHRRLTARVAARLAAIAGASPDAA